MIEVLVTIGTGRRRPSPAEEAAGAVPPEHVNVTSKVLSADGTNLTEEQMAQALSVAGRGVVTREQLAEAKSHRLVLEVDLT